MLKSALILLILQIILMPAIVFANGQETIRESTILFKINADATPAELKKLNALVNPSTILESEEIKGLAIHVVKLRDIKGFEKAFSKQLMNTGAVKFAEPDALIPHAATTPNDPKYGQQWHHVKINSPIAWDYITGPDDYSTVRVCVLDTGVDTDHPDLVDNLLLPGYNARLKVDGSVEDVHGHGTWTSGVVGASGNNLLGVAGMAWDIAIIPVQINISDTNSSAYISDMAVGIEWCASQGVKVANLSYGGAQYLTIDAAAQFLRDSGGLLFMSAGNDGEYNSVATYPDYSSFVIVGATYESDVITSFSEYGPFVDVTAPGSYIYTTNMGGGYSYVAGTSFSSPMTAGLGALIYSINPNFTPIEVENYIFNTAADLGAAGDDDVYGHGRIDAGAAVIAAYLLANGTPIALASASITSGIVPLEVIFDGSDSYDPDGDIVSYLWDLGDGNTASGVEVTHTYTTDGTFDATLTVTDNRAAQSTSIAIVITVDPDPDPSQIDPPSNLTAAVDTNNVTLNWTHNLTNVDGFEIYRAQKVRGKYTFDLIAMTVPANTYVDSDLELGDYRYKVSAVGSYIEDAPINPDFSNEVSVKVDTISTIEPDPGALSAPVLSASSDGYTITLNWTHECPVSECTYHIGRGDAKARGVINFTDVTVDGTGLKYFFTESSGTYYYKVYATAGVNTSDDSNIVSVRLK